MRFHDLRHCAATLVAQGGATTRELMTHIGHKSMAAALRYQHAPDERMRQVAVKLNYVIAEHVSGESLLTNC